MSQPPNKETPTSGLILEEGKFYRNRLGNVVEVRLAYPGEEFCFEQVNDVPLRYRANGTFASLDTDPTAALNLIEEVPSTDWAEISSKLRKPRDV